MKASDFLRALTLWPEWAWAFAYLGKDVENRKWPYEPTALLGKWVAIHGGKNVGGEPALRNGTVYTVVHKGAVQRIFQMARRAALDGALPERMNRKVVMRNIIEQGRGIVAIGKVSGFIRGEPHGWYEGKPDIGIQFSQVVVLKKPVPCNGAQGVWFVPPDVARKIPPLLPVDAPIELRRHLFEAQKP